MKFKHIFMVLIFLFLLGSIASVSGSSFEDISAVSIDDSSLYDDAVSDSIDGSVLDDVFLLLTNLNHLTETAV